MNYPKILNKQGELLAILSEVENASIKKKINSSYTLEFTTIVDELKSEYITIDNQIEIEDNLYNIIDIDVSHQGNNEVMIDVYAEQVITELLDSEIEDVEIVSQNATNAVNNILQGSGFTLGTCNVSGIKSLKLSGNRLKALQDIAEAYFGEFDFKKYTLDFVTQIGQDRGVQFRYGKNLRGITKSIKKSQKDKYGNPIISYKINILELDELEDFRGLETFNLGDTVRIIDEVLGIDVELRILELTYNPLRRINTNVILGNRTKTFTEDYVKEMDEAVENLSQKLGGVEIKISDSSIIATVLNSDGNKTDKSTFEQTASQISLSVETLEGEVATNRSNITLLNNQITLSVSSLNSRVNGLDSEIQSTQSSISILSNSIESKVSQTDYNGNTIASMINQTATTIKLQASKIDLTGITTMYSTNNSGNTYARFSGNVWEMYGYGNKMFEVDLSSGNTTMLKTFGRTIIEHISPTQTSEAVGKWDFSRATVTGLTAVGTVAKFG